MVGETKNQFFLARAALSTCGRARKQFPMSNIMVKVEGQGFKLQPGGVIMKKTIASLVCIVAFVTAFATNVKADLITYTYQGVGSGSIGGASFTDTAFTITARGDTSARVTIAPDFSIQNTAASITIGASGTFNFITATRFFVNNTSTGPNPSVGFSIATGPDIFDFGPQPVFATWDMTTSIGPISGTNGYTLTPSNYGILDTSGGVLAFLSQTGIRTTFEATVVVPEPATPLLIGSGLVGLAGLRRKFKK